MKLEGVPEGPALWPTERALFIGTDSEAKSRESDGETLLAMRGLLLHRSITGEFYEMWRSGVWMIADGSKVM